MTTRGDAVIWYCVVCNSSSRDEVHASNGDSAECHEEMNDNVATCCSKFSAGDVENYSVETEDHIPPPDFLVSENVAIDESVIYRRTFPFMHDSEVSFHYKSVQKKHADVVRVFPLAFLYYAHAICRFNLFNLQNASILYIVAFLLLSILTVLFSLFFWAHVVLYYTEKGKQHTYWYRQWEHFLFHWFGGRIEDLLSILVNVALGINFIARVHEGQCPDNVSIWDSQSCNPFANVRSVPHEEILVLFLVPIGCQIVMRGLSMEALLFTWLSSLGFVVYSIVYVQGWLQIWTILDALGFMVLSFEFERFLRQSYKQFKDVAEAQNDKFRAEADARLSALNNLHRLEVLKLVADNEKKSKELEILQLRGLMGNAAHDLKTPLHSIEADMEVLRVFYSRIPTDVLAAVAEEYKATCAGEIMDSQSLFNSLNATCKFMEMAINRSQDFMKASSNIALLPAMETFEFEAALSMSVTCINHLQTSRTIVVHPSDPRICSHLISDRHWLSENVLCLLSNAIKYSDCGAIDVRAELIEVEPADPKTLTGAIARLIRSRSAAEESSSDDDQPATVVDASEPHHGGEERKTLKASYLSKSMVLFSVEDMGVGISKSMRRNLFQPFKQAQRMAGGTGLGLYSLSKRIEALEGSCGVSSRSDGSQGSMFWFAVPYRPDMSAATVICTDNNDGCLTPSTAASDQDLFVEPLRILVIDDSISILKVTSRLLKMNGHTVETAGNGYVGLERLKKGSDTGDFDMVLTDLQMPVMDGIETAKRFRAFEQDRSCIEMADQNHGVSRKGNSRLMIVGMSANADDGSRQEALAAGMDYFITKPFAYSDLAKILLAHSIEESVSIS